MHANPLVHRGINKLLAHAARGTLLLPLILLPRLCRFSCALAYFRYPQSSAKIFGPTPSPPWQLLPRADPKPTLREALPSGPGLWRSSLRLREKWPSENCRLPARSASSPSRKSCPGPGKVRCFTRPDCHKCTQEVAHLSHVDIKT